jgi:hypothetical protein
MATAGHENNLNDARTRQELSSLQHLSWSCRAEPTKQALGDVMSVIVSCRCGKKFRAQDEHLGKRAKCPACGEVLVILAPTEVSKPQPTPAKGETVFANPAVQVVSQVHASKCVVCGAIAKNSPSSAAGICAECASDSNSSNVQGGADKSRLVPSATQATPSTTGRRRLWRALCGGAVIVLGSIVIIFLARWAFGWGQPFSLSSVSSRGACRGLEVTVNRNRLAAGTVDTSQVALFYSLNSTNEMPGIVSDFLAAWDERLIVAARGKKPFCCPKGVFLNCQNTRTSEEYFVGKFGVDGLNLETETIDMRGGALGSFSTKKQKSENVGIHGVLHLQGGRAEQKVEMRWNDNSATKFSTCGAPPLKASLQVWRKQENGKWEPVSELCKFEFPD